MDDSLDPITPYIQKFEGYTAKPQWDYKQWSVGYGTRANGPNDYVDHDEAMRRLGSEVGKARSSVSAFAPNAPQGVQDALTSLTYNAGPGWQSGGLGKAIQSGDYATARNLFQQYNKAGGQINEGLVGRRMNEIKTLWDGGGDNTALAFNGTPQSSDASSAPAQTAITKAMAGNNNDNTQLPVGARPVMFQGGGQGGQSQDGNGLFSILKGNNVPDTGLGRILGMGNVGSAIGAIGRGMVTAANPAAGAALQNANFNQQLAMNGDLVDIGQDILGRPIKGWVNKMTHQVTPLNSAGANGSAGSDGSGGASPAGATSPEASLAQIRQAQQSGKYSRDELLAMAPPEIQASLKAGLDYAANPMELSSRGPLRNGWLQFAHTIDPTFDETKIPQRIDFQKKLANQSYSSFGGQKQALGTALEHLSTVSDNLADLHNTNGATGVDIEARAENALKNMSVDNAAKINALNGNVHKYSGEIGKLYSGNAGGGVNERNASDQRFGGNQSPTSSADGLEAEMGMLKGKYMQMQQQADEMMGPGKVQVITPMQQNAMDRIQARIDQLRGRGAGPSSGSTQGTAPSSTQAQPPVAGARRAPDGNWYVQQNGKTFRVDQ